MAANIKLKRSAVQSRVPTTTDLELGELGLNTYDGKVYMKKDDGTAAIVEVGGAVDSVNTLTGAVSLGIEDLDDFTLASADSIPYDTWSADNTPSAGEWHINSSFFYLPKVDSNGSDQSSNLEALDGTTSLTISQGGTDYVITNATLFSSELGSANQRAFITSGSSAGGVIATINSAITKSGGITIACSSFSTSLLPLANGDILQYVSADSKFKPAQLPAAVSSIDDLSDVDTSTVAPTDGQALLWDNANSQWEPGTIASSSSIQTATDFELQPATGTTSITRTGATGQSSNVSSGSVGLSIQNSGFTYWSTNPDGLSGTVLDYLVNTATFPIDVDISGTTYTITGIDDDSASGTPNVRLDHSAGVSFSNGVSYTLSLASAPTQPLQNNDILQWVDADSKFKPVQLPATAVPAAGGTFTGDVEFDGDIAADGVYTGAVTAVAALAIDCSSSNYFTKTINANSTFTFTNVPATRAFSFTLELTHTSGTVTWPASVKFPSDTAPSLTTGKTHLFMFITDDGGTTFRGASLVDYTN